MAKHKFKPGDYVEIPCEGGTGNKDFGIVLLVGEDLLDMAKVGTRCEQTVDKDYALTVLVDKLSDCDSFQCTVASSYVKYVRTLSLDELLTHENEFVRDIAITDIKLDEKERSSHGDLHHHQSALGGRRPG